MTVKALIFDINGTVTDILTDEGYDDIYRVLGNFLGYQGIALPADEVRRLFFELSKGQRRQSSEEFPEFDAVAVFAEIVARFGGEFTAKLPAAKREALPGVLAELFRAASRFRLQLYPGVLPVLTELRRKFHLAALSDGQRVWALPELHAVGLLDIFDPVIISSDLGYRKPDARMFELMLKKLKLSPSEVIFIGNDMYRDVYGAGRLGIKTVFFKSNQGDQREKWAKPDYIIYRFEELPEAVRFLTERA